MPCPTEFKCYEYHLPSDESFYDCHYNVLNFFNHLQLTVQIQALLQLFQEYTLIF